MNEYIQGEARIPEAEIKERIARAQAELKTAGLDGLLLTQDVDLLYFTGSMQNGYAFLPADDDPLYYVRRSVKRAEAEAAIAVRPLGAFRQFGETLTADFPAVMRDGGKRRIAADLDVLPASICQKLSEMLAAAGGEADSHGNSSLLDGSALIRRVRSVKSAWEVGRIEAAAKVAAEAFHNCLEHVREGVSELEWIARYEYEIRKRGHIGLMRMRAYNQAVMTGMVASGAAAAEPAAFDGPAGGRGLGPSAPQSVSRKRFARGEPILLDVGCCIDGYVIDQTRTAVIGELADDLTEAYGVTETILDMALGQMRPGALPSDIYAASLQCAEAAGLTDHFMGYGRDQAKFLGHGIGLEVDEWPVLARGFNEPLEAGMVIAIEPKFTFPGRGVVGIEDTVLVTASEPKRLTSLARGLIKLP
ncbi:M24 family metallopeptidase [Paenibacillus beijingensis]|uniref:Peptidase M24 n=1 Tax=Paenibacillus beijingensis TaxID=1126833 RepID=A0A0D5NEN3_9BACL|nr:Xaa-Pro peptidase family protein [Paenibacillus beijingensis]AJY73844.1 peptidase M24 [Paenibacillus beijingensis]